MANYLIQPKNVYDSDPNNITGAIFSLGVSEPATITGLINDVEYVAREFVLSPPSLPFIPTSVVIPTAFFDLRDGDGFMIAASPPVSVTFVLRPEGVFMEAA